MMNPHDPDRLEARIHGVLRQLPPRKAPAGLEARVLAEISRRAALPWWRKSFAHWPAAVRAGFFVVSALAAALAVAGLYVLSQTSGAHQVAGAVSAVNAWIVIARDVVAVGGNKVRSFLSAIPSVWLYGGAAAIALCYASVAALGATAYRALSVGRQTS
jgi:hypothetical protein